VGRADQGNPLVEHKGKLYLEAKVQAADSVYLLDGREVKDEFTLADIKRWVRPKGPEGGRQGVERPVVLRDVALSNVEEIHWKRSRFRVVEREALFAPFVAVGYAMPPADLEVTQTVIGMTV
jgi:hypothetical protein